MKSTGRKTVKTATTSAPKKAARSSKITTEAAAFDSAVPTTVVTAGSQPAEPVPAIDGTSAVRVISRVPAAADVARRSYELFLARGGEHGHDVEDWLQAEHELGALQ